MKLKVHTGIISGTIDFGYVNVTSIEFYSSFLNDWKWSEYFARPLCLESVCCKNQIAKSSASRT